MAAVLGSVIEERPGRGPWPLHALGSTERRSAVSSAVHLLAQERWRTSEHGSALRSIVKAALVDEDRVLRHDAARVVLLLETEEDAAFALLRDRLLAEPDPEVAAVLVRTLHRCVPAARAECDDVLAELLVHPLWTERMADTDHEVVEAMSPLILVMLRLAITEQTPVATAAVAELFRQPIGRPVAHRRATLFREWLAPPAGLGRRTSPRLRGRPVECRGHRAAPADD